MAFNPFKKKEEKPVEQPTVAPKPQAQPAKKGVFNETVLTGPHITEKASVSGESGQYVFRVSQGATKGAVKDAVQGLYGVSVTHVSMTRKPSKKVRLGRKQGIKPGFKKAIVHVKKGQTIDMVTA